MTGKRDAEGRDVPALDVTSMSETWQARWPGCEPVADQLRERCRGRWVRFHSLPGSKRYAEDDEERAVILRRHHEVLSELGTSGESPVLAVTAQYSGSQEPPVQDPVLVAVQPEAWHWRALSEDRGEGDLGWCHLFVSEATVRDLDDLLELVADDGCSGVMIAPPGLDWICHPYDGGMDVLARSTAERDVLRERFNDWLSSLASGM